jgi:hypothetical protein
VVVDLAGGDGAGLKNALSGGNLGLTEASIWRNLGLYRSMQGSTMKQRLTMWLAVVAGVVLVLAVA